MGHDSMGVTVSSSVSEPSTIFCRGSLDSKVRVRQAADRRDLVQEAKRLDDQTRLDLLSSRQLSLIVDLDQTIIHTTVDPTVGEWIAEIREAHNFSLAGSNEGGADGGGGMSGGAGGQSGSVNPNEDALRDVASFELEDEVPKGWRRGMKVPDRTYYTKPR